MVKEKASEEERKENDFKEEKESPKPKKEKMTEISEEDLLRLRQDIKDNSQKYLLSLAESENQRKRLQKEKQEITNRARKDCICEFLQPIDHFENALGHVDNMSEEVKNWAIGFQMILTQFKDVLAQCGVVTIESVGKKFDPHIHEAVETEETDEHEPETVIQEFIKGYKMGESIIRPAKVKVSKALAKSSEELKKVKENKAN